MAIVVDAPVFQPSAIKLFRSPTVEHAAPQNVTSAPPLTVFQETFENPSLQSFYPQMPCCVHTVNLSLRTL